MRRIKLRHVRKYDDGNTGPDSFVLGSATLSDESSRLIGDLALLTRPFAATDTPVDFDAVERLADEAIELVIKRTDWMAGQLGIAESPSGKLHWFPWFEDNDGLLRKPTRGEVLNLEGESRLLWDAIEHTYENAEKSIRLMAAFGVFCCERALDAETRKHIGTIIEMYSAAGVLLGHANYLVGCMTESGLASDRLKRAMSERGSRRWEAHPTQKAKNAAREPEANRKGWIATQFHRALSDAGHVVPFDTARKWLTALRKTGTC